MLKKRKTKSKTKPKRLKKDDTEQAFQDFFEVADSELEELGFFETFDSIFKEQMESFEKE